MSWVGKFFQNRGWLGITQYNSTDGLFYVNGTAVTGLSSYTWAQFTDSGFDLTVARHVKVTDRHSTFDGTSTPGSLWWIDPTATAIRKRNLVSGPIYYATYATAIAEVPAASWPNHRIVTADTNKNELVSNATRYAFKQKGPVLMASTTASDTISTNKNTEKIELQWAIPAGFLAIGDVISIDSHFSKSGTTASNFMARDFHIGTAGTTSDTSLNFIGSDVRATSSASNTSCSEHKNFQIMSATTVKRAGAKGSIDYAGFTTTNQDDTQTISNISNALYFSMGYYMSAGTTDTITFQQAAIYLEMRS